MDPVGIEPELRARTATPADLRELVRLLYCIAVLKRRCVLEPPDYLWRVKYKVASHLYRVCRRRAGDFELDDLPVLSHEDKRQLLQRHPLLQRARTIRGSSEPDSDWMQELRARVARIAVRMQSHRTAQ